VSIASRNNGEIFGVNTFAIETTKTNSLTVWIWILGWTSDDSVYRMSDASSSADTLLEDIEFHRDNEPVLDALGAHHIPDSTPAGDFCRRLREPADIDCL